MGGKLLIVGDDVILLKHLARLFLREGHDVTTAAAWPQALQHLERVYFDALVVDLELPDGEAMTRLAGLRSSQRHPRIVLMTAPGGWYHEPPARGSGVIYLTRTPLDLEQLIRSVTAQPLLRSGERVAGL